MPAQGETPGRFFCQRILRWYNEAMNRFNDPDDFHIADAVVCEMLRLKAGEVATVQDLVAVVAPGWEPEDLDLSGIDFQVRKIAREKHIALLTLPEFRENPESKPYQTPFRVLKRELK